MWSHTDNNEKANNCDLNIQKQQEDAKPENSIYPYIQINLLETLKIQKDSIITITVPKIKLSNQPLAKAYINFKLIEETPGMINPIIVLY